ncbi:hypothetical protein [Aminobacter sp. MDW-2]|uniref:hypothetical protein n=1 Tax=Aminobacter sp. MDW-2 TaxID=2666139 RepID=UPI0012AF6B57|nr:hypothetical protein [Aminobacter sp. MDW-2]MRX33840.1 hypothetical protein [Aminobacter sp. MDW-2]QNH34120.1 hypothetical protein H5P29_27315 [Aminobacter sp. MDW-2]
MAESKLAETGNSLARVQSFPTETLARQTALGSEFNFSEAIEPAERLVGLFKQIPAQYLGELPESKIEVIRSTADATFSLFQQVDQFDPKQTDSFAKRTTLIDTIKAQYDPLFSQLSPLIAFTSSRLRDFGALEREARAAVQVAKDRADEATSQLQAQRDDAERILDEVRRVAAEQGVSQQAIYFQTEGATHEEEAKTWRRYTINVAIGLGIYAVVSTLFHKVPWLAPAGPYEAFQLGLSKVLIFGVIAYMLLLSAKNFLAHKHNAIVNRHRYNALLTFTALADAAKGPESRDIVLTHAAGCIFAPQDTGYTKGNTQPESVANIIQSLPRALTQSGTQG